MDKKDIKITIESLFTNNNVLEFERSGSEIKATLEKKSPKDDYLIGSESQNDLKMEVLSFMENSKKFNVNIEIPPFIPEIEFGWTKTIFKGSTTYLTIRRL